MLLTILINVIGIFLIFIIVKWFWFPKEKNENFVTGTNITIYVKDGVYQPAYLKSKRGETLKLEFIRKDPTPCSEVVVFPELNISETLPLGKKKVITITPPKIGEYEFTCQMGMYRGKLVVE